MERALSALQRVLPVAAAIRRGVRLVAQVAAGAAALIALALLRDGLPERGDEAVVRVLAAAAVFAPAVILLAFYWALGQLLALPERLRVLPGEGRVHAEELARIVRERNGRRRALPLRAWRLFALGRSSRELLTPYAPLAPLFSPPFLLATLLSLLATPVLVVAALAALVALG